MSDNPTYNGVPLHVMKQVMRARDALSSVSNTVDFMNLGTIALLEGMSHLSDWIAQNPTGEDDLQLAIKRYIAGREDIQ